MHRMHVLIGLSAAPLMCDPRPCKDPGSRKKSKLNTQSKVQQRKLLFQKVVNFSTLLSLNFAMRKLRPKGVRKVQNSVSGYAFTPGRATALAHTNVTSRVISLVYASMWW